jgi:CRISPR-associated endoribonuclease Cas6
MQGVVLGSRFLVLGSLEATMPDTPDLYAFVIRLRPERGAAPPDAQGHQAQALFLDLVRQVDPELSQALHAHALSKPFTVAVLPQTIDDRRWTTERSQTQDAATNEQSDSMQSSSAAHRPSSVVGRPSIELRVAFTRAEFFAPITRALLEQTTAPTLRLGRTALALADVFGTPGSHAWAGYDSFTSLAQAVRPAGQVTLEFATPTAFGQATLTDGRKRLGLLPAPDTVFKSIAQRWNELAPPALAINLDLLVAACADTLITRYTLETRQINLGKGPQKGFAGRCSYELPINPEQRRTLTLLADAVFYTGVGMKTARGMGLCRRIEN